MSRTPDFYLKAMDKETGQKDKVGAAWINDNGSISIVINRFVTLSGKDNINLVLFKKDLPSDK